MIDQGEQIVSEVVEAEPTERVSAETVEAAKTTPDPLPPRPRQRRRWLNWAGTSAIMIVLVGGSFWVGYKGLFALAGATVVAPKPAIDPDPTGVAAVHDLQVTPDEEGVVISWNAENLGERSWYPSSHHWKPLYDELSPLPIVEEVRHGQSTHMAVRLTGSPPAHVGWQLVGLSGPAKGGKVEVEITVEAERK
jgi:hypothetical protein